MKLVDMIASAHNWLSDKDFIWWPFSFLRPLPNERITFSQTLTMTGCFGGLTFVFFTVFSFMNNAFSMESTFWTLISCFLGFLLWFNAITKPLWNRRATKLQKRQ